MLILTSFIFRSGELVSLQFVCDFLLSFDCPFVVVASKHKNVTIEPVLLIWLSVKVTMSKALKMETLIVGLIICGKALFPLFLMERVQCDGSVDSFSCALPH